MEANHNNTPRLKQLTARSLKWNVVDRVASQILYAVTGIVLARELSQKAFGMVGALLVFQAFALLMVDSGFSYALIQRKRPTQTDYSSIFWFNLLTSVAIYIILWICAPLIADLFGGEPLLIPLSRVMFLSFIINAAAIVQTNRLMKQMNVKPIALINALGLTAGGVVGITLAVSGAGAWAIVWQTITLNIVKTGGLWIYCRWTPQMCISMASVRSLFKVGGSMMLTSFLNTLFLNIYSFIIGNRVGLTPLGYYTQSDKWSKLGIMSLSQVLTSSFLPTLSEVQDDPERFARVASKMSRFAAYLLFPSMMFLVVMATPIFHVLFGVKWDASIVLFQILLVRGIFTVLNSLYNNYILSLGFSRYIFRLEVLRDVVAAIGIVIALPYLSLSTADNVVAGLEILLWGQLAASAITWVVTLIVTARVTSISVRRYLLDLFPYFGLTVAICIPAIFLPDIIANQWWLLIAEICWCLGAYIGLNALLPGKIQREVFHFLLKK